MTVRSPHRLLLLLLVVLIPLLTYDIRIVSFLGSVGSGGDSQHEARKASSVLGQWGSLHYPKPIEGSNMDGTDDSRGVCGEAWSFSTFQNPGGSRTQFTSDTVSNHNDNSTMLQTTMWIHRRSDAPSATGWIQATIVHGCTTTNITTLPSTAIVSRETVVCANPPHATNTVFVIEWSQQDWDEVLELGANINLWHFHASVFRLWAGVQIGQQVVTAGNSVLPWVVLYVPETVFARFQSTTNVFVASPEHLLQLGTVSSSSAHLERLQGVADVFRGRLLVMRAGTATIGELHAAVRRQVGTDTRMAWVRPPNDGLLWDLAWDAKLQINNAECRNSLLHRYRNDILQGLSPSPIHKAPPAQHVCFLSRQRRSKWGSPDRGSLRNLAPDFLLQLLGRLGSPLLVTPNTALRRGNSSQPTLQQTLSMNKISIAEQLQFVYEECAVLLGVHGAGLTNTLGLRPGTAVIELLSATGPSYQYFRNLAQLLPHVDYTRVENFNGTGRDNEKDLRYSDDKLFDQLHVLIEQKLQESIQRQQMYADPTMPGTII